MDSMIIRIADVLDIDEISKLFDLYRQFYEQESNPEMAKEFIQNRVCNNESTIIVACDKNGEMLGFCQLYPTFCSVLAAPIFALYDLFVTPNKRRAGAGKMLLLAAENLAIERGISRLDLTTARSNLPAQALYESLGWEKDTVFLGYNKILNA